MKVIIFHGWGADSNSNWFPWLKNNLKENNIEVIAPDLPNTHYPEQRDWIETALKLKINENTILVGHSLGTVLILRILEKIKVKAAFLVAGFDEDFNVRELKNFFNSHFNYGKIKKNAKIYMLSSDNDPYIPLNIAERLSENLNCKLRVFHGKEHLNLGTINFTFPELKEMILSEISKKN